MSIKVAFSWLKVRTFHRFDSLSTLSFSVVETPLILQLFLSRKDNGLVQHAAAKRCLSHAKKQNSWLSCCK